MCNFDGRLVAWLDRELPADEAADIERHLKMCAECRKRADAYERASAAFNTYCNALSAAKTHPRTLRPKLAAVGAVAAVLALAFLAHYSRTQIAPPQPQVSAVEATGPRTAPVGRATAAASPRQLSPIQESSIRKVHRQNLVAAAQRQDANPLPAGPTVQITIPAEAVLPPGAALAGENFVVDFSIAPDGSAQGIRLQTQLTGFEGRATQP
jgi:hypothetical protein